MIELRQLHCLNAAAEAGSFSRAARNPNIKQTTRRCAFCMVVATLLKGNCCVPEGEYADKEEPMYVGSRLLDTLSRLNTASSTEALRDGLADAGRLTGFPYVALVQHGGLPRLVEYSMVVTNYPEEFVQFYIDNHYFVIDPIYDVSQQLDRPFGWEEITNIVELADHQHALFEEAQRYGIVHGITVPLHIPSESHASCTFAGPEPVSYTHLDVYKRQRLIHHREAQACRTGVDRQQVGRPTQSG